jgi:hypothetical protein
MLENACLHGALIDEHAIEFLGCFGSETWLAEDDVCNAAALTSLVVLE